LEINRREEGNGSVMWIIPPQQRSEIKIFLSEKKLLSIGRSFDPCS
jgi:hypothetical protein